MEEEEEEVSIQEEIAGNTKPVSKYRYHLTEDLDWIQICSPTKVGKGEESSPSILVLENVASAAASACEKQDKLVAATHTDTEQRVGAEAPLDRGVASGSSSGHGHGHDNDKERHFGDLRAVRRNLLKRVKQVKNFFDLGVLGRVVG